MLQYPHHTRLKYPRRRRPSSTRWVGRCSGKAVRRRRSTAFRSRCSSTHPGRMHGPIPQSCSGESLGWPRPGVYGVVWRPAFARSSRPHTSLVHNIAPQPTQAEAHTDVALACDSARAVPEAVGVDVVGRRRTHRNPELCPSTGQPQAQGRLCPRSRFRGLACWHSAAHDTTAFPGPRCDASACQWTPLDLQRRPKPLPCRPLTGSMRIDCRNRCGVTTWR